MTAQTTQPFQVRESTSSQLTATLKDEAEVAIPAVNLSTLTLMLYDQTTETENPGTTGAIINNRNRQDILNANGGTVDANGLLTMVFEPADNVIINTGVIEERHVALLEYTYAAGLKAGKEEVLIDVFNYSRTT